VNLKKVDSGVPAAVLRYQANSYQSIVDGDSSSHHYLGLDASLPPIKLTLSKKVPSVHP
ncbi:hypothetical protein GJD58_28575, partial [Klebsiella pneumoniae]|nr:hypothetical protein [Klebsiella pneumoniae]